MTSVRYIGERLEPRTTRRRSKKIAQRGPLRLVQVLAAVVILGVFAVALLRCNVGTIRVYGGELVELDLIQSELRKQLGQPLLLVNKDEVVKLLERDPWVRSVSVQRRLPGELRVVIEATSACLRLENGAALASDGRLLPRRSEADLSALPLLRWDDEMANSVEGRARLASLMSALAHSPWSFEAKLAEIRMDSESVILEDGDGIQYRLAAQGFERSLQRLAVARQRLYPREGDLIDLRFERQIVLAPAMSRGREG